MVKQILLNDHACGIFLSGNHPLKSVFLKTFEIASNYQEICELSFFSELTKTNSQVHEKYGYLKKINFS